MSSFCFPNQRIKIKFIDEFIDCVIETGGFVLVVYGTWQHSYLIVLLGIAIIIIGLIDLLIRFGYKRAIEKNKS